MQRISPTLPGISLDWIEAGRSMFSPVIFATRPSALARWQTQSIIRQLQTHWDGLRCEEQVITTRGDRVLDVSLPEIGGKGLFTYELEDALRAGRVHAAVHSLKDLPTEEPPGLVIGAISQRADPRDVLVCPAGQTLEQLPEAAVIGTDSNRRRAQLLACRPDFQVKPIRGNIDTRIRKAQEGEYDAILLAAAGMIRLGMQDHITQYLPLEIMLPAPGQGALAVQCRSNDKVTLPLLEPIDDPTTRLAVTAERAFLAALGGGCSLPVGALAFVEGTEITLHGVIGAPDGRDILRLSASGGDPALLGAQLAGEALDRGARSFYMRETNSSL
jgi:hydroxymethylbilane synthase